MLLRGPEWQEGFPWVYGSIYGTSVLLTMPILWWVFGARGRFHPRCLATALAASLASPCATASRDLRVPLIAGVVANAWLCVVHWSQPAGTW